MAKPRVFVSSTFYDLKYVRSSLEVFIESLGYEPVLSEKGDIAFTPDKRLEESCYREVENSDIYTLIIGGRYGSEARTDSENKDHEANEEFFRRYESITKREYETAVRAKIPIYVLIEKSVYAEYSTYLKNSARLDILYAHVDSPNVYAFINQILSKERDKPFHPFDIYEDIENWLRDQWAGFFRELLNDRSAARQLASLASQVASLSQVTETLKSYLEEVLKVTKPEDATRIIREEQERLSEVERVQIVANSRPFRHWVMEPGVKPSQLVSLLIDSIDKESFVKSVKDSLDSIKVRTEIESFKTNREFWWDVNEVRQRLGLTAYKDEGGLLD